MIQAGVRIRVKRHSSTPTRPIRSNVSGNTSYIGSDLTYTNNGTISVKGGTIGFADATNGQPSMTNNGTVNITNSAIYLTNANVALGGSGIYNLNAATLSSDVIFGGTAAYNITNGLTRSNRGVTVGSTATLNYDRLMLNATGTLQVNAGNAQGVNMWEKVDDIVVDCGDHDNRLDRIVVEEHDS